LNSDSPADTNAGSGASFLASCAKEEKLMTSERKNINNDNEKRVGYLIRDIFEFV
jgi:hypothetical protein